MAVSVSRGSVLWVSLYYKPQYLGSILGLLIFGESQMDTTPKGPVIVPVWSGASKNKFGIVLGTS